MKRPDEPQHEDESRTALGVAAQRAAHLWLDEAPPILDDPVSARLVGPHAETFVREHADRYLHPGAKALRASLVVRSRFAEDELAEAAVRGVRQAVMLGAGLDTFAYRQPAWADALGIAELDHPASQASKLQRLAAAGIAVPVNVRHAAVDLVTGDLAAALQAAEIDLAQPVLAAWLGVMMYLPPEASDRVLGTVARLAPGSVLVLTFAHPAVAGRDRVAERAEAAGEPWLDRPGADGMASRLAKAGFDRWRIVPAEEIHDRYFAGRRDLSAPSRPSLAVAWT
jgi:methyltransferase (TIGR00027 family)